MANKSARNYFRRLAEGYEYGLGAKMLGPLLTVFSAGYNFGSSQIRSFYEKGILKKKKLPFPVVSVGNLTWGGSGKTPFVEYLAHRVGERDIKALVLTRGYGADESEQFRQHLPKAVIGIGKNRGAVAEEAYRDHKVEIAFLDDGFQHWALHRDLEILMVNALNPFGNRKLIPRGILREPIQALKRAHVIVISHSNLVGAQDLEKLKSEIRGMAPESLIVDSYLEPLFFYRSKKKGRVPLEKLQNHRVTTFSGVAAPRSFQLLLSRLQIKPVRNFEFSDHHLFSDRELKEIKEVSDSAFSSEIITTEKDYYRIPEKIGEILNPLILATRLRISSGEQQLNEHLFKLLGVIR